jgi:hypothetical protein
MVYGSNVGTASTSIISTRTDGSQIGIGTYFVDNVYQVSSSEIIRINVTGIGFTYVNRIFANISGINTVSFGSTYITFDGLTYTFDNSTTGITTYSGTISTSRYFGNFSWGAITLSSPIGFNSYSFYGDRGIGGISTSSIVKRTTPLKYNNYLT